MSWLWPKSKVASAARSKVGGRAGTANDSIFAPEFSARFYRKSYPDIAELSDETLREHYESHGRREGRKASPHARTAKLIEKLQELSPALEIGPFDRPALRGPGVSYVDVLDKEGLKKRAIEHERNPDTVPEIDYVVPGGDLSTIADRFALVFSSHTIEHQPDLVRHLRQVETLLAPDGVYALVIPDCRYCFDHFIAPSTIANVLQAHHEERRVHTLASAIEHLALVTHNDPSRHWRGDHGSQDVDPERVKRAMDIWTAKRDGYLDVHAWQFTPGTFREIISTLNAMGLIELAPIRVYDTLRNKFEFGAILGRTPPPQN